MRHLTLVIAAGLGLTACSTQQMLAEHDDQACQAKGLEMGSVGYVDCRAGLDKERADAQARSAAMEFHNTPGTPGVPRPGASQ